VRERERARRKRRRSWRRRMGGNHMPSLHIRFSSLGRTFFLENIKGNAAIHCLKDGQSLYLQTRNLVQPQLHKWGCENGVNMITLSLRKRIKKKGDRRGETTNIFKKKKDHKKPAIHILKQKTKFHLRMTPSSP